MAPVVLTFMLGLSSVGMLNTNLVPFFWVCALSFFFNFCYACFILLILKNCFQLTKSMVIFKNSNNINKKSKMLESYHPQLTIINTLVSTLIHVWTYNLHTYINTTRCIISPSSSLTVSLSLHPSSGPSVISPFLSASPLQPIHMDFFCVCIFSQTAKFCSKPCFFLITTLLFLYSCISLRNPLYLLLYFFHSHSFRDVPQSDFQLTTKMRNPHFFTQAT